MALVALGFIRLVDLIGVKNQAMFLFETDTWFSDFIFPGRFILWFVSMISHPEPDVFFCRPKIMAVQLGLSEASHSPSDVCGFSSVSKDNEDQFPVAQGMCDIHVYNMI